MKIKHFIIQLMLNIQYVDTIKIIKYFKMLQHVSDHTGSIFVDMDKVGVMTAFSDLLCVCVVHCSAFIYSELHTRTTGQKMLS